MVGRIFCTQPTQSPKHQYARSCEYVGREGLSSYLHSFSYSAFFVGFRGLGIGGSWLHEECNGVRDALCGLL